MRWSVPSTRDLRRERLVGNWGGASEHIGRRWEEVGLLALRNRVASFGSWPTDGCIARKIVPLAGDDALQTALARSGLPNPDAILLLENGAGEQTLQALDFKWNLEFASYGQIRSQAIGALLAHGVRPLRSLLLEATGQKPEQFPVLDGLLCAPDLPVNHWFLSSEANGRQEYPVEPHEVIFVETDPLDFFSPLPGWEMALLLAQADRAETRLRALESSEHYYRIGAGLQGAVSQLAVSIFVRKPPAVDAQSAFAYLRSMVRLPSSEAFLQHAEKLMATRASLAARLRNLTRSPYRFSDLMEALKERKLPVPETENSLPARERERWGNLLRQVAVEHRGLIYRTGLHLVQAGLSDTDALARLEADPRRYADRARAHGERLLAAELGAGA